MTEVLLLLQIQFAQKTDKVGKRGSQQSDGKIGSGKRVERDKLERVELVGDEKEKKSSSWRGGIIQVLKMKEEVKQLKSLSYKNQDIFGVPQMLVSCQII